MKSLWSSKTKLPILLTMKELEYFRTELPVPVFVPAEIRKSMYLAASGRKLKI